MDNNAGAGTFFGVVFRYLAITALSLSWPFDHGKTSLMRRSLITRWGGPRSEATQSTSEVDRFLTGKSLKCWGAGATSTNMVCA